MRRSHDVPDDPLERLERNERSGRMAFIYAGAVITATLLSALAIGVAGAIAGGPNCDAGLSSFLCSRAWELAFPLIPGAISLIGALGCFVGTYLRFRRFERWRPWLAMCWVLLPFTLMWMTSTFTIALFGVARGTP